MKLNQKQLDLKKYMLKNDLILEDVMEVVLKDDKSWNPIRISLVCNELKQALTTKCVSSKKQKKVVYNHKPDPVTKITEYDMNLETGKYVKVKEEVMPVGNKTYALTGSPKDKCIVNGNTWKESEVK